eukprot:g2175.t1
MNMTSAGSIVGQKYRVPDMMFAVQNGNALSTGQLIDPEKGYNGGAFGALYVAKVNRTFQFGPHFDEKTNSTVTKCESRKGFKYRDNLLIEPGVGSFCVGNKEKERDGAFGDFQPNSYILSQIVMGKELDFYTSKESVGVEDCEETLAVESDSCRPAIMLANCGPVAYFHDFSRTALPEHLFDIPDACFSDEEKAYF